MSRMSWFPRPASPRAALADLAAFMRQRSREQVIGGALALLATGIIVFEFIIDPQTGTPPPPRIIYVDSWSAKRSDAEIKAQQKKDQAERRAYQAEKQRQFKELENQLGMN
jgi:hypothetical protein